MHQTAVFTKYFLFVLFLVQVKQYITSVELLMENVSETTTSEGSEANSIAISLEDAAQLILQQQGLVDGAVTIAPGTYQILTQGGTLQLANAETSSGETTQNSITVVSSDNKNGKFISA